jgi:C1A family cysteine protease
VAFRYDVYASFYAAKFNRGPAASMYEHKAKKAAKKGGHAVSIIGYGQVKDGRRYWVLENSWGSNWYATV